MENLVGVRVERSGPVLFVDSGGLDVAPGRRVAVELAGDGGEQEATVIIGAGQMLAASISVVAGRVVRAL